MYGVYGYEHAYHPEHVEIREQFAGVTSLLPLCGYMGIEFRSLDLTASTFIHWNNPLATNMWLLKVELLLLFYVKLIFY